MAIPKEYYGKIINNQDFSFALSSNHPSETSLDNYKGFKYTIHNNKSIDDLVKSVRQILLSEEIL